MVEVTCPHDIMRYQESMDGVDSGNQHRVTDAYFSNVSKNGTKRIH